MVGLWPILRAPNLYADSNIEGWKKVVERVHGKGGYMYGQLFHAGE